MNLVTSFIIATTTHSKPLLPCFDYLLNLETANGQVLAGRSGADAVRRVGKPINNTASQKFSSKKRRIKLCDS